MNLQPILETSMVKLRPLKPSDFDDLYACASDPGIWSQHPQMDRYQKDVFQEFFDGAIESQGAFVIIDKVSNRIIGSSRYYQLNETEKCITIGYTFLTRQYWGGKYNFDVKKLMIEHALEFVDLTLFEIGRNNIRSRKAIERLGGHLIKDGEKVIYGINKMQFHETFKQ